MRLGKAIAAAIATHAAVLDAHHIPTPPAISGLAAAKPDAALIADDILYYETDTTKTYKAVAGTWVWQPFANPWGGKEATLAEFQATPATGTMNNPDRINNGALGTLSDADTIGKYGEIDFKKWVRIDQWRMYGWDAHTGDGRWKIEYYGEDLAWHDWVTGIITNPASWSSMASETEVVCYMVRLTATAIDSLGLNQIQELEVYHS